MFSFYGWRKAAGKIPMHAELYVSNLIWLVDVLKKTWAGWRVSLCVLPISDSEVTLNNMFTDLTISIFLLIRVPEIVNKRHATLVPVVSARHWLSSEWISFHSVVKLKTLFKCTQIFKYFILKLGSTILEIVRINIFLPHEKPGATKTKSRHTVVPSHFSFLALWSPSSLNSGATVI